MQRTNVIQTLVGLTLAVAMTSSTAWAQPRQAGFPSKPVTIIVPFAAGQSGDVMARVLGEPLGKLWGHALIVDNKAGAGGVGSFQHLTFEMLKQRSGVQITHVPYRGSAPAYNDLFGGQLHAMFDSLPAVLPHIKSGKVRVLAVSTAQRVAQLPDVPTVAESGIPGFDALGWLGIVAPKGLDPAMRERLNADLKSVLADDAVRSKLTNMGMIVLASSTDEFGKFIDSELTKWGQVIKTGGITAE